MARRHAEVFLELLVGRGLRGAEPAADVPESARACCASSRIPRACATGSGGAPATNATAAWAATAGHEHADLDPEVRRERPAAPRPADGADRRVSRRPGARRATQREPRVSVSRSIFALVDDRDRAYFGHRAHGTDQIGYLDETTRAVFGRTYAAEPDVLVEQLAADTAIAAADTLLLTVPNQLGVDYNAHVIESILTHVAPALGWR